MSKMGPGNQDRRNVIVGNLLFLEDLLWEWVAIQERSIRIWRGKDALWWYGERTALGALAGAVWRSGGFVLEEYSTEKLPPKCGVTRSGERCAGRGDMDFELGARQFTVEAKSCWARLTVKGRFLQKVEASLGEAKRDADRAQVFPNYSRLAVVFAAPYCLPRYAESVGDLVSTCLEAARHVKDCSCAWAFPGLGRKLVEPKEKLLYPGAVLFVKWVGGRRPPA